MSSSLLQRALSEHQRRVAHPPTPPATTPATPPATPTELNPQPLPPVVSPITDEKTIPKSVQPRTEIFLIISSRDLTEEEQKSLDAHGGVFVFTKKYIGSNIGMIDEEMKPTFYFFNVFHRSVRDYLHSAIWFFQKSTVICLRQNFEDDDCNWIKGVQKIFDSVNVIKVIPENISSHQFCENLKIHMHIPLPKSRKRVYLEKGISFLAQLL
jgi:hypothetical protein